MKVGRKKENNLLAREFLNDLTWYYIGVKGGDRRWLSGAPELEAREAVKAFESEGRRRRASIGYIQENQKSVSGSNPRVDYSCIQSLQCSLSGERLMPETHEAEIQAEEDVTKVQKDSADIMKE